MHKKWKLSWGVCWRGSPGDTYWEARSAAANFSVGVRGDHKEVFLVGFKEVRDGDGRLCFSRRENCWPKLRIQLNSGKNMLRSYWIQLHILYLARLWKLICWLVTCEHSLTNYRKNKHNSYKSFTMCFRLLKWVLFEALLHQRRSMSSWPYSTLPYAPSSISIPDPYLLFLPFFLPLPPLFYLLGRCPTHQSIPPLSFLGQSANMG